MKLKHPPTSKALTPGPLQELASSSFKLQSRAVPLQQDPHCVYASLAGLG